MLFSIIIPVYNVETYLDECLHSILSQATEFKGECEVLLIDDGQLVIEPEEAKTVRFIFLAFIQGY